MFWEDRPTRLAASHLHTLCSQGITQDTCKSHLPLALTRGLAIVIKPAMSKQQLWQHVLASQPATAQQHEWGMGPA